jgi:hypothetical protein
VLELTYTSYELAPWAADLGFTGEPFRFDPDRRAQVRAELDAYYARLYGLTRDELRYILDPADTYGDDYPTETFRVLKNNEIRTKLEAEKVGHRARMAEFSDLYRFVVKELLGDEVDAGVDWSGKSIAPFVNYHGKLDSAALETVRLLAFDVASLADAYIREAAWHPRFLLHDSPREADLSVDIYHSLFWLVARLEEEAGKTPPFQYIITTTEPPPENIRQSPWLLHPVLRTTEASERFLGVDL